MANGSSRIGHFDQPGSSAKRSTPTRARSASPSTTASTSAPAPTSGCPLNEPLAVDALGDEATRQPPSPMRTRRPRRAPRRLRLGPDAGRHHPRPARRRHDSFGGSVIQPAYAAALRARSSTALRRAPHHVRAQPPSSSCHNVPSFSPFVAIPARRRRSPSSSVAAGRVRTFFEGPRSRRR